MQPIDAERVLVALQPFVGRTAYVHLETTNGAYTEGSMGASISGAVGAFMRNAQVTVVSAQLKGKGPFRAGLQMAGGWAYAEGLTDWEVDPEGRLLLAGHDKEGRLAVALQLSLTPFPM